MKKLKSLLKETGTAPDINPQKFAALIRMGLLSPSKLPLVKRALGKDNPGESLSTGERGVLRELIDALMDQVMNNPMIYNKVKQNLASIHEDINGIDLELLKEADVIKELADLPKLDRLAREEDPNYNFKSDKNIPPILIMKRKAIRIYPGNQKVALYYIQSIDRYVSIPFGGDTAMASVNEEEQLDEISQEKLLDYSSAANVDYSKNKKKVNNSIDKKTGIITDKESLRKRDNRSKGLRMASKKIDQLDEVSKDLATRAFVKRAAQAYDFGDDDTLEGAEKRVKASMKLDKQDALMKKRHGARYEAGTEDKITGQGKLNIVRPWAGEEAWRAAGARAVQNIKNEKKAKIKKVNDNSVTKLKGVRQKVGLDPIQGGWEGFGDLAVRGVVGSMKLLHKGIKALNKKPVNEEQIDEAYIGSRRHMTSLVNKFNDRVRRGHNAYMNGNKDLENLHFKKADIHSKEFKKHFNHLIPDEDVEDFKLGNYKTDDVGEFVDAWMGKKEINEEQIDESSKNRPSHYHFTYAKDDPEGLKAVEQLRKDSKGTHVVKQRGRGPRADLVKAGIMHKHNAQSYITKKHATHFDVYTYPKDTQNMNRAMEKELKKHNNSPEVDVYKIVSKKPENQYSWSNDKTNYGYKPPMKTKMDEEIQARFRQSLDEAIPSVLGIAAVAGRAIAGVASRAIGSKVVTQPVKKVAEKITKTRDKSTIDRLSKNINNRNGKPVKTRNIAGTVNTSGNNTPSGPSDTDLGGPRSVVGGKEFSGDRLAGSGVSTSGSRRMPTATTQGDFNSPTQNIAYRKQMVTPVMREDTQIDILKNLLEHNLEELSLIAGKDTFKINNAVAKKILEVYNSMNRKNKIRMVEMLSESEESFKKIADFAVNYTKRF